MRKMIEETGNKYGRLNVIKYAEKMGKTQIGNWLCKIVLKVE